MLRAVDSSALREVQDVILEAVSADAMWEMDRQIIRSIWYVKDRPDTSQIVAAFLYVLLRDELPVGQTRVAIENAREFILLAPPSDGDLLYALAVEQARQLLQGGKSGLFSDEPAPETKATTPEERRP